MKNDLKRINVALNNYFEIVNNKSKYNKFQGSDWKLVSGESFYKDFNGKKFLCAVISSEKNKVQKTIVFVRNNFWTATWNNQPIDKKAL